MITLVQFPASDRFPNFSPFCAKLEAYMRMSQIPFEIKTSIKNGSTPKGKFPVIEDEGKVIEDSTFIIEYLKQKYGDTLDQGLTPEQRAIGTAFQRLAEENMAFCLIYNRWQMDEGWDVFSRSVFRGAPGIVRVLVGGRMRKSVVGRLHGQGIGRHSPHEVSQILRKDLQAIADYLGSKKYFFGDKPAGIDASLFGVLGNLLLVTFTQDQQRLASEFPTLVNYVNRILKNYFSA